MTVEDEIIIPVLEIVPGWDVDDLETLDDCDDAHVKLMCIIAEIEFQIDMHDARLPIDRDLQWLARAKRALKLKRAAAQCVNNKRGKIGREERERMQATADRKFIETVKRESNPEDWVRWCRAAQAEAAA